MTAAPPRGPPGRWPTIVAGLPAGLAGFMSGHPWWGLVLLAVLPAVNVLVRDYLRPLLQAYGAVHPRRVRVVGKLKTDLKKDAVRHRAGMARVRHLGALEREVLEQHRRTQKMRAKAADLPRAGAGSQLRAVSAAEVEVAASPQPADESEQGRHRRAG